MQGLEMFLRPTYYTKSGACLQSHKNVVLDRNPNRARFGTWAPMGFWFDDPDPRIFEAFGQRRFLPP